MAAPVVAEARGLHRYTIVEATSSVVANRFRRDEGRTDLKNSASNAAESPPPPIFATKVSTPSERVGPGSMLFTVMPVPATDSAMPRAMAADSLETNRILPQFLLRMPER